MIILFYNPVMQLYFFSFFSYPIIFIVFLLFYLTIFLILSRSCRLQEQNILTKTNNKRQRLYFRLYPVPAVWSKSWNLEGILGQFEIKEYIELA